MPDARFFDTSAFVKRYINESGTDKVLEWCDKATEIGLSALRFPKSFPPFVACTEKQGLPMRNIGN